MPRWSAHTLAPGEVRGKWTVPERLPGYSSDLGERLKEAGVGEVSETTEGEPEPDAPEGAIDAQFGKVAKIWVPEAQGPQPVWGYHLTKKAGQNEPLVYLSTEDWSVGDLDGNPRGGSPRGTVGEVKTDRGWQWVAPGPGRNPDRADALHHDISVARGWAGMRVQSPETGDARVLRPGPCVYAGGPGAATYEALARTWEQAGGIALPLPAVPRRTEGCPRTLGRLDSRLK